MFTKSSINRALVPSAAVAAVVVAPSAHAGTLDQSDAFYTFATTIEAWMQGAFGLGLAFAMMLLGMIGGLARNSPMPALSGIAAAALLRWGPGIVKGIMVNGGLI